MIKITQKHMKYPTAIATKFIHKLHHDIAGGMDELISAGMYGLAKAHRTFDESKPACFETYAHLIIYREIEKTVRFLNKRAFPLQRQYENSDSLKAGDIDMLANIPEKYNKSYEVIEAMVDLSRIKNLKDRAKRFYQGIGYTTRETAQLVRNLG